MRKKDVHARTGTRARVHAERALQLRAAGDAPEQVPGAVPAERLVDEPVVRRHAHIPRLRPELQREDPGRARGGGRKPGGKVGPDRAVPERELVRIGKRGAQAEAALHAKAGMRGGGGKGEQQRQEQDGDSFHGASIAEKRRRVQGRHACRVQPCLFRFEVV